MRETTNLKSWWEKRRKGSNKLASVALAGALLWPVTWQAQEVKLKQSLQNQKEMVVEDSTKNLTSSTIKFENAKQLKDIDSIVDILMWLEVVQEQLKVYDENEVREALRTEVRESIKGLRAKYSDEYVNRTLFYVVENTDIRNQDLDEIIKKCAESEEFQEAYKKWDEDTMLRIIEEMSNVVEMDNYLKLAWVVFVLFFMIVVGGITWRQN